MCLVVILGVFFAFAHLVLEQQCLIEGTKQLQVTSGERDLLDPAVAVQERPLDALSQRRRPLELDLDVPAARVQGQVLRSVHAC